MKAQRQSEAEREAERRQSRLLLARADRTRRRVHEEVVELLSLLDGDEIRREMEGIENAFRRNTE